MTVNDESPRLIPTSRIGIFYGYCVCLIAMGITLVGLNTAVSRVVDLSFQDARVGEQQDEADTPSWMTFRDYKQHVLELRAGRIHDLREEFAQQNEDSNTTAHTRNAELQPLLHDALLVPTDEELRSEYTKLLARDSAEGPARERRALTKRRYDITRDLLSALQLFFTGAILFILHWRWVQRRIERVTDNTPSPQDVAPLIQ